MLIDLHAGGKSVGFVRIGLRMIVGLLGDDICLGLFGNNELTVCLFRFAMNVASVFRREGSGVIPEGEIVAGGVGEKTAVGADKIVRGGAQGIEILDREGLVNLFHNALPHPCGRIARNSFERGRFIITVPYGTHIIGSVAHKPSVVVVAGCTGFACGGHF